MFLVLAFQAQAQYKPWGLGIIINSPTGFSMKHRMSQKNSFDAALGYSFGKSDNISIHGTYLWENNRSMHLGKVDLGYFLGIGGAFYSRDKNEDPPPWAEDDRDEENAVAIRGSGGINYYFMDPSFEVFAEASLDFFFIPSTDFDLGLALGGRYYF